MAHIRGDTLGMLYILCFDAPLGNAQNPRAMARHYLGYSTDLPRRLAIHQAGQGQPLTAAAVARGIGWQVFYRPGTPALERYLKAHHKNTPSLCPRCAGARGHTARYGFQPLDQLAFDLDSDTLPDVPIGRADWLEMKILREWRQARVAPVGDLSALDDLI